MRKARILVAAVAGIAAAAGVTVTASAGYWRAPENVVSATAPGYRSDPPVLRPLPEGREKPVVVVLADNEGTETTDFIVPYGMLKDSGVADVRAVSSKRGPVELMPALRVRADETVAEFDRDITQGADIVVVPAMHRQDNPVILDFLRRQSEGGALIVSICDGAWVVANAGLFDGGKATGHWFSFTSLARKFPETTWVRDARIVADGQIISTTGVSASIPVALAVVEAIAGPGEAEELAVRFGIGDRHRPHDSDAFGISGQMAWTALSNLVSFWSHEELAVDVDPGFDEIAVALQADAWSRTFRSSLVAHNEDGEVESARGLTLVAEPEHRGVTIPIASGIAEASLDQTLTKIELRYGSKTAGMVADQLEYEWRGR